jgi:tripartite-type tricarboxylate transporter receptor subunit TctC
MKLPRRRFLHLAAGFAALPTVSRVARAQAYPSRPVRLMVGYPAGGGADITARLIGQGLSELLGHPFVVENGRAPARSLRGEASFTAARSSPPKVQIAFAGSGVADFTSNPNYKGTSIRYVFAVYSDRRASHGIPSGHGRCVPAIRPLP